MIGESEPNAYDIIDTSSYISLTDVVIQLRGISATQARQVIIDEVLPDLQRLVDDGILVYPIEVIKEGENHFGRDNQVLRWLQRNQKRASRHGRLFERVAEILAQKQIANVLDADKEGEEADPHILALAKELQDAGKRVTVVTEDRIDTPKKLSLVTACNLLWIRVLPLKSYLLERAVLRTS